ncbi:MULTISPECIES: SMI1/KNR4 family protein [unclassified Streptomyces]|uniref:SMI1/KNR4 family protein n=1 Tax=unclassified Streptomyces TaxID=2593676 RepID=UPI0036E86265
MTQEPQPPNLTPALDLDALTAAVGEQPDRPAAWRFVRAFARDWSQRPLAGTDGCAPADLDATRARLGLPLPAALREGYQLLGSRTDLTGNQDVLLAPQDLYLDEDRGVLVFRVENQSCAYWGIRVTDLDQDDPPVVVRADLARPTAADWEAWLGRVSVAFVEIVLSEALCADEDLMVWVASDDTGLPEDIAATFQRLPFPEYPISRQVGSRWYAHDEIILRDDRGTALFRARTEAALDRFDGEYEEV